MTGKRFIQEDPHAVAQKAASLLVDWAAQAVTQYGFFHVALAGGGTPNALYRLLLSNPQRWHFPWPATHVYWGDERFLPPGDPGRNDSDVLPLLIKAGVPESNIHPIPYQAPAQDMLPGPDEEARWRHMEQAATRYEQELLRRSRPGKPLLDVVLLGLGSDGHTASLFPGTAALHETSRLVVPNRAAYEDRHPDRITLTLPAINGAGIVVFLVTGESKRNIVATVLGAPTDPPLPAQRVQPEQGALFWLMDQAAAGAS
jgi:6-phosphogluconolactonase